MLHFKKYFTYILQGHYLLSLHQMSHAIKMEAKDNIQYGYCDFLFCNMQKYYLQNLHILPRSTYGYVHHSLFYRTYCIFRRIYIIQQL